MVELVFEPWQFVFRAYTTILCTDTFDGRSVMGAGGSSLKKIWGLLVIPLPDWGRDSSAGGVLGGGDVLRKPCGLQVGCSSPSGEAVLSWSPEP